MEKIINSQLLAFHFINLFLTALYSMQYAAGMGGLGGLGGFPGLAAASTSGSTGSSTTTTDAATAAAAAASGYGGLGTLGVAASQAASLGMNQASAAWFSMAQQLAAQDYLTRIQAATRDPNAFAALAAQGVLPNYEMLTQGSKSRTGKTAKGSSSTSSTGQGNSSARSSPSGTASPSMLDSLRLPSDTEIIKYTSSSTGPRVPGTTNRGRKKTISLDPAPNGNGHVSSSPPSIPPGLTIERKRPGSGMSMHREQPAAVDKVEITKVTPQIAAAQAAAIAERRSSSPRSDFNPKTVQEDRDFSGGLNLSMKPTAPATITTANSAAVSAAKDLLGASASSIPAEYYACEYLDKFRVVVG